MKQPTMVTSLVGLAVVALVLSGGTVADATIASTCKAAAASNVRVSRQLCVSQLGKLRGSADADPWGLAKLASLAGVNSVALAADDIKALQAGNPSLPMRPALAKCATAYGKARAAFTEANDEISRRKYVAGREKLDEALAQVQGCNAAFGAHSVVLPQPLAQHTVDSIQLANIAGAITGLMNIK